MPTYVTLFRLTQDAKESVDTLPDWFQEAEDYAREVGAELLVTYFGDLGAYDGLIVFEASRDEKVEMMRLTAEQFGTVRHDSSRVYEPEEYYELIETALG